MSVNFVLDYWPGCGRGHTIGHVRRRWWLLDDTQSCSFIGIPPAVAVSTEANQIVASSVSGVLAHWRRGNVDIPMGLVLTIGGFSRIHGGRPTVLHPERALAKSISSSSLCYVVFLGIIGGLMLIESINAWRQQQKCRRQRERSCTPTLGSTACRSKCASGSPSSTSRPLLPLFIGFFVGVIAAIMGVGGGFVLVPAMIYLLGMPTVVVVGTSLFQIIFVMINVTIQQAYTNQTVDIVLGSTCSSLVALSVPNSALQLVRALN